MANKQNRRPSIGLDGILLRAALVIVCLVMLCVHLMGGLLARYSSTASGSDSARVAKFDVQLAGPEEKNVTVSGVSGENGEYTFTLVNHSEVAVSYALSVSSTNMPKEVTPQFAPSSGNLAPGASQEITLTFAVEWSGVTGPSYSETFDFSVTAHVEQID